MATSNLTEEMREQVLSIVEIVQQNVVGALESIAEQAQRLLPQYATEFAEKLPTATQVVDRGFDRLEQMLKTQRDFATKVAGGFTPSGTANPA